MIKAPSVGKPAMETIDIEMSPARARKHLATWAGRVRVKYDLAKKTLYIFAVAVGEQWVIRMPPGPALALARDFRARVKVT